MGLRSDPTCRRRPSNFPKHMSGAIRIRSVESLASAAPGLSSFRQTGSPSCFFWSQPSRDNDFRRFTVLVDDDSLLHRRHGPAIARKSCVRNQCNGPLRDGFRAHALPGPPPPHRGLIAKFTIHRQTPDTVNSPPTPAGAPSSPARSRRRSLETCSCKPGRAARSVRSMKCAESSAPPAASRNSTQKTKPPGPNPAPASHG